MDLTDKLVADFVKAAAPKQERKPEEYTIAGVVQSVNNNGTAMVLFDGATSATECQTAVSVSAGDKVIVSVRDRQGTVTSNMTRVTINADYLEAGSAKFKGNVTATSGTFSGSLNAATGSFTGSVGFTWNTGNYYNSKIHIGDSSQPAPIYMTWPSGRYDTEIEPGFISLQNVNARRGTNMSYDRINISAADLGDVYCLYDYGGAHPGSDKRIKRNIEDVDPDLAKNLRPVSYRFAGANPNNRHYGFIAQEVKPLIPTAVMQDETNGLLCLTYHELIAPTLALAQENAREIEALKQEIAELKGEINELKHNSESSD